MQPRNRTSKLRSILASGLLFGALLSPLLPPTAWAQTSETEKVEREKVATIEELVRQNRELKARVERIELEHRSIREPVREEPARVEVPMSGFPLRPTLLAEVDYRVYPHELEGNVGFALARLRPGLVLAPTSWMRAVATVEFAGENPAILDSFVRLRAAKWAEFTIGYSKPPLFASFAYELEHLLPFPDRSSVVSTFGVQRDVGVDVHVSPESIPFEGWLRIGNGTGSALGNDNALPAAYGLFDLVLGRAWTARHPEPHDTGLRLGVSGLAEKARDRDGLSGHTPLGFVYYRPIVVSGVRLVGEAHAIGYLGALRLTLEGAIAREERDRDDDGNPATPRVSLPSLSSYGLGAELAWTILGTPRQVGIGPRAREAKPVVPAESDPAATTPEPSSSKWNGGALEVAVRYDGLFLNRRAEDVRRGGSHNGGLALKWWPVDFMTATVASYLTRYEDPPIEEPAEKWSWGLVGRIGFFWGIGAQQPSSVRAVDPSRR